MVYSYVYLYSLKTMLTFRRIIYAFIFEVTIIGLLIYQASANSSWSPFYKRYAKAFGLKHVNHQFSHADDFASAINHAWDSFLRSPKISRDFLYCRPYMLAAIVGKARLKKSLDIDISTTYVSPSDDVVCYTLIGIDNRAKIESFLNAADRNESLLVPVPTVLKLDASLSHVLAKRSLTTREATNLRDEPVILKHVVDKEPLFISIVFKSNSVTIDQLRESLTAWQDALSWNSHGEDGRGGYGDEWADFFWTYEDEDNKDLKLLHRPDDSLSWFRWLSMRHGDRSKLQIQEDVTERSARERQILPTVTEQRISKRSPSFRQSERRKSWLHWKREIKTIRASSTSSLSDYCSGEILKNAITEAERARTLFRKDTVQLPLWRSLSVGILGDGDSIDGEGLPLACLAHVIAVVSKDPNVKRIALSLPVRHQNNGARSIVQTGLKSPQHNISDAPLYAYGLNGSGIIIGVSDTGIDRDHCFFRDDENGLIPVTDSLSSPFLMDLKYRKVVSYVNYSGSNGDMQYGHGTHVAGTLAGYCLPTDKQGLDDPGSWGYKGMAPAAKLAFFDIAPDTVKSDSLAIPYHMKDLFDYAYEAKARIHSNSWGGSYWYDSLCLEVDEYLFFRQDFLTVFAAGNNGGEGLETILSPGLSKNTLSVAASLNMHYKENYNNLATFSSMGPCPDGRLKPDISAPGTTLYSSRSHGEPLTGAQYCDFTPKSGTSMATPVTAGSAALIKQYFEDDRFWASICNTSYPLCKSGAFAPLGTTLKALVLHSGDTMTQYPGRATLGTPPDIYQGYGRLDLSNILVMPATTDSFSLFLDEALLHSLTELVYDIVVESVEQALKVTISWFDPPNEVFAAKTLLHDLDLVLMSPSGVLYYGNCRGQASSSTSPYRSKQRGPKDRALTSAHMQMSKQEHQNTPTTGSTTGSSPSAAYCDTRDEHNNNEQVVLLPGDSNFIPGLWKLHVQSNVLTEYTLQRFSLAVTTAGYVDASTLKSERPIDAVVFSGCPVQFLVDENGFISNFDSVEIDVSLWSRVGSSGWGSEDFYDIIPYFTSNRSLAEAGKFTNKVGYQSDSYCLASTLCYQVSLHLTESTQVGNQLSIPQCGIYLGALHTTDSFCISDMNATAAAYSCEKYILPSDTSSPSRFVAAVPLLLFGGNLGIVGDGWSGAYYAVMPMSSDEFVDTTRSVGAGTLEWSFEKVDTLTLPLDKNTLKESGNGPVSSSSSDSYQCFMVVLSVPSYNVDEPYDPIVYFLNSTLAESTKPCPYMITSTSSMARVCVGVSSLSSPLEITFYRPAHNLTAFGTMPVSEKDLGYVFASENRTEIGRCLIPPYVQEVKTFALPTPSPTPTPTPSPSFDPSVLPTVVPSFLPTSPPILPSAIPTVFPSFAQPTPYPSSSPTESPSAQPSHIVSPPTTAPTQLYLSPPPSNAPSESPTSIPSAMPSATPSFPPSSQPSSRPSYQPSSQPSSHPTASHKDTIYAKIEENIYFFTGLALGILCAAVLAIVSIICLYRRFKQSRSDAQVLIQSRNAPSFLRSLFRSAPKRSDTDDDETAWQRHLTNQLHAELSTTSPVSISKGSPIKANIKKALKGTLNFIRTGSTAGPAADRRLGDEVRNGFFTRKGKGEGADYNDNDDDEEIAIDMQAFASFHRPSAGLDSRRVPTVAVSETEKDREESSSGLGNAQSFVSPLRRGPQYKTISAADD